MERDTKLLGESGGREMKRTVNNSIGGTPTTVRVPEAFLEKIKKLAAEIGDSQNGTMMHLMYLGMKIYEGQALISFRGSQDNQ